MIKEYDCVALRTPVPEERLEAGDVGIVVHIYKRGVAFEVEFLSLGGKTMKVVTLEANQVRPVKRREFAHARELEAK